jgi:hypothetical protein
VHYNRISTAEWYAAVGPLAKTFSAKATINMDDTSFDNETVVGKVRTPKSAPRALALDLTHPLLPLTGCRQAAGAARRGQAR